MRRIIFVMLTCLISLPSIAQYAGKPTYHDSFANYYLFGGYQQLYHPSGTYHVGTFQAEVLFSFAGSRAGISYGPDYISYSPCGLLLFAPAIFIKTMNDFSGKPIALLLMLPAISAMQFHIPLSDHIEISAGWDALKFTKMKNFDNCTYISGSINAGLICFLGDHFFLSGYYEYNHAHNPIVNFINWIFSGLFDISNQPKELNGHSFGVRTGYMF